MIVKIVEKNIKMMFWKNFLKQRSDDLFKGLGAGGKTLGNETLNRARAFMALTSVCVHGSLQQKKLVLTSYPMSISFKGDVHLNAGHGILVPISTIIVCML